MKRSNAKSSGKLSLFPAALFNRRAAAMLATGAMLLAGNPTFAATNSVFIGPSGDDFNTAADWYPTGVPNTTVNANVSGGKTVLITTDEAVNDLNAGGTFTSTATPVMTTTGNGTYMQTAGNVTVGNTGGWFRLGVTAGTSGKYLMSGGTFDMNSNGELNVGENNGTNVANASVLDVSGGAVFDNLHAGALQLSIGGQDNGGGGVGTGIFNLSDATSLGTTVNNNGELWIGENAGSTGVMNMSGGTLNNANWIAIGRNSATGTLNLSGGTINKTGGGNITTAGIGTAQTATINQTGGVINNTTSGTWIGETGHGIYNISAGSANLGGTGYLDIGRAIAGQGIVNLSGTGLITTSQVQHSGNGTGTFNFNGGTLQAAKTNATFMQGLTAANVQAGGINIDPNSFTITVAQPLLHSAALGATPDGGLTVNDSTAAPGGTLILTGANTYTGATTITNGTLQLGNGTTDGSILSTSGVTDNSALVYNLAANRTAGYVISGTGTVTVNDTGTTKGTLTLTKPETYTGATNLTAGNLTLDHSGTNTGALGNTAVNVNANTLLVKGSTVIGSPGTGSLSVGTGGTVSLQDNAINTLGIGGPLTLSGSNLNFDLGTASGSSDAINVGGAVTNGGATLNLDALGSIVSGASTYTLLTAASGLGANFALGTTPAGFNTYSLTSSTATAEILSITANPTVVGAEYFTGAASRNNGDAANNFGFGSGLATPASNFSTDRPGLVDPKQVPGATTDLIFTANNATASTGTPGVLTTQLDGAYDIRSLTFDVPAATGITSTVINTNGHTLTIGAGGLTVASTSNSDGTINGTGGLILNGSQSFADNSTHALTVSPATITGNAASGTNTLTFAGTGSGPVTVGGVIGDGTLGGNLGLVVSKTGGGVLTLSGANTYTGGTTLNSGTVVLGSTTALGAATSPLTFGSGSTSDLQLAGNSVTVGGLNTNATTVGTPIIENASATAAALTDNSTTSDTYAGILRDGVGGGALGLNKTGPAATPGPVTNLTLTGANTFTGDVNITNGSITINNSSALGTGPKNININNGTAGNDSLILDNGGGANPAISLASNLTFNTSNQTGTGTIINNNGANTIAGNFNLTAGGGGTTFTVNSGTLALTGNLTGAAAAGSTRNLTLAGPGSGSISGNILNGTSGVTLVQPSTGTWTLSGTGNTVTNFFLNQGNTVLATGASLTTTAFSDVGQLAGDNSTLTLQPNATLTVVGDFNVSDLSGSNGTLNITTGDVVKGTTTYVGKSGNSTGTVNQTGGSYTQTGGNDFRIGGNGSAADAAAVGTYNISGGTLTAPANFQVGAFGHGTLNQTGGTVNAGGFTDSGRFAGSNGLIDVEGGNFNQTGGAGTPTTQSPRLIDGEEGTGIITVGTAGTITASGGLVLGLAATGNGTFNLNTGGTLVTPFIGDTIVAGGTATTPGTGTFNFNGGTLRDATTNAAAANAVYFQGITTANVRNGGAVIDTNGNTATINQPLLHSAVVGDNPIDGGLTVKSATPGGVLILTGANTYTGATTITGGNLTVGNGTTGTIANTSAVNVNGNTTLTVDNNGALNNTATAVTLGSGGSGGTLQNGLNGVATTDGTGNSITNNVQQAGTLNLGTGTSDILDFANNTGTFDFTSGGASLSPGQRLTVENFGAGINEMLNGATPGTEVGSYQLLVDNGLTPTQLADITFLNSDSTQFGAIEQQISTGVNAGKFQVLESAVAAPEPAQTAALGLFGLGLGALILKARKRKAAGTLN